MVFESTRSYSLSRIRHKSKAKSLLFFISGNRSRDSIPFIRACMNQLLTKWQGHFTKLFYLRAPETKKGGIMDTALFYILVFLTCGLPHRMQLQQLPLQLQTSLGVGEQF